MLEIRKLSKRFGGLLANNDISLSVPQGEIHAIIGPNGAGKSTLIGQIAGELSPTSGTIAIDGMDVTGLPAHQRAKLGLARCFQITSIFPSFSTAENVAIAAQATRGHSYRFWQPADSIRSSTGQRPRFYAKLASTAETCETPGACLTASIGSSKSPWRW